MQTQDIIKKEYIQTIGHINKALEKQAKKTGSQNIELAKLAQVASLREAFADDF